MRQNNRRSVVALWHCLIVSRDPAFICQASCLRRRWWSIQHDFWEYMKDWGEVRREIQSIFVRGTHYPCRCYKYISAEQHHACALTRSLWKQAPIALAGAVAHAGVTTNQAVHHSTDAHPPSFMHAQTLLPSFYPHRRQTREDCVVYAL